MSLYGYPPTPELDQMPRAAVLGPTFERIATPEDLGEVWRALELGMQEGEMLAARNPHFVYVYNTLQIGQIHMQVEQRPPELRPSQESLDRFWAIGAGVSRLRGFILLDAMA